MSTSSRVVDPQLEHPRTQRARLAKDGRGHDLPARRLRDGVCRHLAMRQRGLGEVPERSFAADRLVDGSRRDQPTPGNVAGDGDEQGRVRSLDQATHDLEVAVQQEGERQGGREVDRRRELRLALALGRAGRVVGRVVGLALAFGPVGVLALALGRVVVVAGVQAVHSRPSVRPVHGGAAQCT